MDLLIDFFSILNVVTCIQSILLIFFLLKQRIASKYFLYSQMAILVVIILNTANSYWAIQWHTIDLLDALSNYSLIFVGPSIAINLFSIDGNATNKKYILGNIYSIPLFFVLILFLDLFANLSVLVMILAFLQMGFFLGYVSYLFSRQFKTLKWIRALKYYHISLLIIFFINLVGKLMVFFGLMELNEDWLITMTGFFVVPIYFTTYMVMKEGLGFLKVHKQRYAKTPLDTDKTEELLAAIQALIEEEKYFLKNDLNLQMLAKELNAPSKYISQVVNLKLNKSFSTYINELRIEYAKNILLSDGVDKFNISGIGLESGFRSNSQFYSSFKKYTGLTPTDFIKKHKKNSENCTE